MQEDESCYLFCAQPRVNMRLQSTTDTHLTCILTAQSCQVPRQHVSQVLMVQVFTHSAVASQQTHILFSTVPA